MLKRKFHLSLFPALILMLVLFQACAGTNLNQGAAAIQNPESPALQTPFARESYRLLSAEVEIYNAAWLSFKDLHEAGIVSDSDFEKGRDLARKFYRNFTRAVDLVLAYEKGTINQGEAKSAVELALSANKILQEYLKPKLPQKAAPAKTSRVLKLPIDPDFLA